MKTDQSDTNICTRLFLYKNNKNYVIKIGVKFWSQVLFCLIEGQIIKPLKTVCEGIQLH